MYLVIRTVNVTSLDNNTTMQGFFCDDPIEVSKRLESGNFKAYKLDALQEVKEIIVKTEETLA